MVKKLLSLAAISLAVVGIYSVDVAAYPFTVAGTPSNAKMAAQRSEEDIKAYLNSHPFDVTKRDSWNIAPDYSNNIAGELSESSRQNALNTLNVMRYVAGLNETSYDYDTEKYAQASSTLMIGICGITHYPERKAGVSDELYTYGAYGAKNSNLGAGYDTISEAILYGWMGDGDPYNIDRVGHRRWALSPDLEKTSFGISVGPGSNNEFTSMYCIYTGTGLWNSFFGSSSSGTDVDFLTWPASKMPAEYMYGPWSILLNSDYFRANENDVNVTLTNLKTNKSYYFDKSDKSTTGEFFNINTGGYGSLHQAVIFDAKIKYNAGDRYLVKVEGLKDNNGNAYDTIEYTVDFFSLYGNKSFGRQGLRVEKDGSTSVHTGGSGKSGKSSGRSGGGSSGGGGGGRSGGGSSGGGSGKAKVTFNWGFINTDYNTNQYFGGSWFKLSDGSWNYFRSGSTLPVKNDWVKDNGHWFYLGTTGSLIENSWLKVNNSWFYAKAGGYISENEWLYLGNKWYYTQSGGYTAINQWLQINGKWYCFDSNCALYVNTTTPDGYRVDANGAWIK